MKTALDEEKFVKNLEKPEKLARKYIQIYGISPAYSAFLSFLGILLAFLSVPVIPLLNGLYVYPESLAALAVLLLAFYVAWVFIRFPSSALGVGIAVFSTRIGLYILYAFCLEIGFDVIDGILFLITTAGVVAIGFALLRFSKEEETDA